MSAIEALERYLNGPYEHTGYFGLTETLKNREDDLEKRLEQIEWLKDNIEEIKQEIKEVTTAIEILSSLK